MAAVEALPMSPGRPWSSLRRYCSGASKGHHYIGTYGRPPMYPLRYTAKARAPRSLIVVSIQLVQRYARARRRTGAAAQKPFQRRGEVFPARQGGEARGRGGGPETAGPGWRPHPSGRRLGESGCGTKRLALGRRVCVTSFGFSAAATPLSALSKEPAPNAVVLQPCQHVLQQGLYTRPRSCS
jgi:hypothetical protein